MLTTVSQCSIYSIPRTEYLEGDESKHKDEENEQEQDVNNLHDGPPHIPPGSSYLNNMQNSVNIKYCRLNTMTSQNMIKY